MTAELVKLQAAPDLVDQVYRALLDAISDGSLAPGTRVTQEDLAERLAVSRQPVLQALRLLKKDGLVLDAPGRGVLVAPLDPGWIAHVYEVRGALDALAAKLAAARHAVIDPRLIETGRRAARGRNIKAMIEADIAFHHAIYAASGNPLVERSAQLALGAPAPRDGRGAAADPPARADLGRARRDRRSHPRRRRGACRRPDRTPRAQRQREPAGAPFRRPRNHRSKEQR